MKEIRPQFGLDKSAMLSKYADLTLIQGVRKELVPKCLVEVSIWPYE